MEGIKVDTALCAATVFAHGAHITEWTPKSSKNPVLWVSEQSWFKSDKAIRGGVPICWPWFAGGRSGEEKPSHGYARIADWTLIEATVSAAGEAKLVWQLIDRSGLPGIDRFPEVDVKIVFNLGNTMTQQFVVTAKDEPIDFEIALHTYYSVSDINKVRVQGLDGKTYFDKVAKENRVEEGDIVINAEKDGVYEFDGTARIVDEGWGRTITVDKAGSKNTVVWNPWIEKSAELADFGDDEWKGMICVEVANMGDNAVKVAPGETFTMTQVISVS